MNSRNAYFCNHTEHISRYQRSAYSAIFQQQIKTNDNSQSPLNPQTIMTNNFSLINICLRISGCRALQIFSRFIQKLENLLSPKKLTKYIMGNGNLGFRFSFKKSKSLPQITLRGI